MWFRGLNGLKLITAALPVAGEAGMLDLGKRAHLRLP